MSSLLSRLAFKDLKGDGVLFTVDVSLGSATLRLYRLVKIACDNVNVFFFCYRMVDYVIDVKIR